MAATQFGEFLDHTEIFTPSLVPKYSMVFPGRELERSLFPLESKRLHVSVTRYRDGL